MSGEPIRVLVADDHPMFREGITALLDAVPDMALVGAAADGNEAVRLAAELQPDVVVMDLHMAGRNGIEATRAIVADSPRIGVLALTMFDEDESVFQVMRAGARGFLLKGADQSDILRAVRAIAAGDAIFGPAVARRMMGYFGTSGGLAAGLPFGQLTDRERQVLSLVAEGRGNNDIARALLVTTKTVRNHLSNVFTKLQVSDRAEAIVRAREAGLGIRDGSPG